MEEGVFCGFSESSWQVEKLRVVWNYCKMNGWVMWPWVREQMLSLDEFSA